MDRRVAPVDYPNNDEKLFDIHFQAILVSKMTGNSFISPVYLLFCFSLTVSLPGITACADTMTGNNQVQLLQLLSQQMHIADFQGKEVYVSAKPLKAGTTVTSWNKRYQVPAEYNSAWFFFIDNQPGANWEHACLYVVIDTQTMETTWWKGKTPPDMLAKMNRLHP